MTLCDECAEQPQILALWDWATEKAEPEVTCEIPTKDVQLCVRFNPSRRNEIVTNGDSRTIFWHWKEDGLHFYAPPLSAK